MSSPLQEVIDAVERNKVNQRRRQTDAEFIESARTYHGETFAPSLDAYVEQAVRRMAEMKRSRQREGGQQ